MNPEIRHEMLTFFTKVIVPSFLAISLTIAVKLKRESLTWLDAFLSYVIGISLAILSHHVIYEFLDGVWHTITIGTISMLGEKIGNYIVFRFNFNKIGDALGDFIVRWIGKK